MRYGGGPIGAVLGNLSGRVGINATLKKTLLKNLNFSKY